MEEDLKVQAQLININLFKASKIIKTVLSYRYVQKHIDDKYDPVDIING